MSPESLDPLTMLLEGQRDIAAKLEPMGERMVRVEEQVKAIVEQRKTAQDVHDDCRQEMHRLFAQNETAHNEMTRRVGDLEADRLVRTGQTRGAGLIWKVIAAIMSFGWVILGILSIAYHW